jgi:uncharacterized protein YkwD
MATLSRTSRRSRPRAVLVAVAAALAALAVSCGGAQRGRFGGISGSQGDTVHAPGESATSYETTPSQGHGVLGAESDARAVAAGVAGAARAAGLELTADGRLAILAGWIAERLGEGGEPPPHEVIELFTRHLGLVEPAPHLVILGQPDRAALEASVRDSTSQFLGRQRYDHFGAAVVDREGLALAVIVLSTRPLTLAAVPRRVEVGAAVALRGRLGAGLSAPTLALTAPDGEVRRLPGGAGPSFDLRIPLDRPGTWRLELLAQGSRGDTVVANFPIFAGVPIPDSVTLAPAQPAGAVADVRDVEQELFRLVNEARRAQSRSPVASHPDLASVARAHSRDMVDHHFVGHTSPTTGTASDRLARAGVRSGLVLENIGRGYSAAEIHRGLLESPGHRANLVNPDVTHVGVGVVAEREGGRTAFVATQVFVRMAQEIDVAAAPAQLLASINRARQARGARALDADPNLERAARDAAVAFFADPTKTQQDTVDDASASLRRFAIQFRRIGGLMAVVTDLSEAAALEPAFDREVRYVGIGVAQGTRPDTGPNAIAVVIVLGWAR